MSPEYPTIPARISPGPCVGRTTLGSMLPDYIWGFIAPFLKGMRRLGCPLSGVHSTVRFHAMMKVRGFDLTTLKEISRTRLIAWAYPVRHGAETFNEPPPGVTMVLLAYGIIPREQDFQLPIRIAARAVLSNPQHS